MKRRVLGERPSEQREHELLGFEGVDLRSICPGEKTRPEALQAQVQTTAAPPERRVGAQASAGRVRQLRDDPLSRGEDQLRVAALHRMAHPVFLSAGAEDRLVRATCDSVAADM